MNMQLVNIWRKNNLETELSNEKLTLLEKYMELVLHANESLNLTAITARHDFIVKHIIDSMTITPYLPKNCDLIDVGTGAGFPGVVVKIACDGLQLTLLEGKEKKVKFLKDALGKIELEAEVLHGRSEELPCTSTKRFDVVTARAVGRLDKLAKSCLPLVKQGGVLLAMKGPYVDDELQEASGVIKRQKGEVAFVKKLHLPGGDGRTIVVINRKS